MKVVVGGKMQEKSMLDEISDRTKILQDDPALRLRPGSLDIDLLGGISNPHVGDRRFMEMLRNKSQIDTQSFAIPRKPGFIGVAMGAFRQLLWKLLRYQHDRMSSRQNRVNSWIISALESRTNQLHAEIDQLRERLTKLEKGQPETQSDKPDSTRP